MRVLSWDVGIYNLCYCLLEKFEDGHIEIIDWNIVNLCESEKEKKDRNLLFENIPKKLMAIPTFEDIDYVVIENQPVLKNPQMKSIQMILYSYFLIVGKTIVEMREPDKKPIKSIDFCSAMNKLKNIDSEFKSKYGGSKMDYKNKKKCAIDYVDHVLKDNETFHSFYKSHKKKDDLADSYLQGMFYLTSVVK